MQICNWSMRCAILEGENSQHKQLVMLCCAADEGRSSRLLSREGMQARALVCAPFLPAGCQPPGQGQGAGRASGAEDRDADRGW
eukprot:scaffold46162_cov19-Tisochrysis_lutea.AAC.2